MNKTKAVYFENLDGLRAIAAFAVVFAHVSYWFVYPENSFFDGLRFILSYGGAGGRLGVIFFFILSGFLITYLMYQEQQKNQKINVFFFYVRRILRIWPLYFATLIVGFLVYPYMVNMHGGSFQENASFWMYSLFAANFDHIYNGYPTSNILGVQWSVSVEEQFYLLWPLIFTVFNKKKMFVSMLVGFIGLSELFSIIKAPDYTGGDYHLFACIRYLSYGALIAYFCFFKREKVVNLLSKISKPLTLLIYLSCLIIMILQYQITEKFGAYQFMYHIVPVLFFCFVLMDQNLSNNSFFKIGKVPFLSWLGKISYGIYLTHMIALNAVIYLFSNAQEYVLLKGLAVVLLTVIISATSYYTLEKYFLSLKKKFSYFT